MSHSIDENYSFYRETARVAAKEHRCSACAEEIAAGHRYYSITLFFDAELDSIKRCLKCQTIHEHLRGLAPGEMWPAERLDCGEEYTAHWGCEPPEEIARLAFMTPDEAQRRLAP